MKIYFRLLSYAKPYSKFVPLYLVFAVLTIIFGIVNFTLLIPLLDVFFNKVEVPKDFSYPAFTFSLEYFKSVFNFYFYSMVNDYGRWGALLFVCSIILLCTFFSNFFKYLSQRLMAEVRSLVVYRLRKDFFHHVSDLPLSYYQKSKKGNLISMMTTDMNEIENSVVSSFIITFREPLMIVGYFIVLFIFSVKLTLFTILYLPFSVLIIGTLTRRLRKSSAKTQNLIGDISSVTDEAIGGIKVVKAFNAESQIRNNFDLLNIDLRKNIKSFFNKRELSSPFSEFLGVSVVIGILVYGGYLVLNDPDFISSSAFITYLILYSQVLTPAKSMVNSITTVQRGLAAAERVFEVIDLPKENKEEGTQVVTSFNDSIKFENVSFKYDDTSVLNNISFSIPKGKVIALVGPSGSGKTTIADLLPRFYDVHDGKIILDNYNLNDIPIKSIRSLMGMVTQEPVLFHDTIYNNIAFGMSDASEEKIIAAAKIANAHDFILQTDNGYQTIIGDRGVKLSGGQRQRLSIARAVLKNPPILILDEATSALDTESERLVQEALFNLMKNRTSLVIAHRLSTIQAADEIIVLKKGEIIERGNHLSLMNQNGFYKKLVEMQGVS
jgi:subfamily B ATP-binding cassette protein MsbA